MASLLDLYVQRNPVLGGLLGGGEQPQRPGPAPPPIVTPRTQMRLPSPPQESGGFGDKLGQLFSGPNNPYIGDAANRAARKQSLLLAGLATLASGREGLEALAEGALFGQKVGSQSRTEAFNQMIDTMKVAQEQAKAAKEEAEAGRLRQVRHEILSGLDFSQPEQRAEALSRLIQAQDFEGAEQMTQYIQRLPTLQKIDTGEEIVLHDPFSGQDAQTYKLPEKPPDTEMIDTGRFKRLINSQTGAVIQEWDTWAGGQSPSEIRADIQRTFSNTGELAREYTSLISTQMDIADNVRSGLRVPAGSDANAAPDLTLLSAVLRAQDPGATVRDADVKRGERFGGASAWVNQLVSFFAREGKLPDDKREALRNELIRLAQEARLTVQFHADRFRERAVEAGLRPDAVVFDPFEPMSDMLSDAPQGLQQYESQSQGAGPTIGSGVNPFDNVGG